MFVDMYMKLNLLLKPGKSPRPPIGLLNLLVQLSCKSPQLRVYHSIRISPFSDFSLPEICRDSKRHFCMSFSLEFSRLVCCRHVLESYLLHWILGREDDEWFGGRRRLGLL